MKDNILMQSANEDWMTPEEIWRPGLGPTGKYDLDPCAEPGGPPYNIPAHMHFTHGALTRSWLYPDGSPVTVFMNPPYNKRQDHRKFVEKLLAEYEQEHVTRAIVLLAARTETSWYRDLGRFPRCHVDHRLKFLSIDGEPKNTATFPSVIFGLGITTRDFHNVYHHLGEIVVRY